MHFREYALLVKDGGLKQLAFENLVYVGGHVRIQTPRMCYPDEIGLEAKFRAIPGAILDKNVSLANSSNCLCKYS